jgi:primosomal protein N' (replication factor Y) (superfamily II helicase)
LTFHRQSLSGSMVLLRIALDTPTGISPTAVYDYTHSEPLPAGARVRVPFARKPRVGIVLGVAESAQVSADKLKPVEAVLDDGRFLSEEWRALTAFCARYYRHPLGSAMLAGLPTRLREPDAVADARLVARYAFATQPKFPASSTGKRNLWALLQSGPKWGYELMAASPNALKIASEWASSGHVIETDGLAANSIELDAGKPSATAASAAAATPTAAAPAAPATASATASAAAAALTSSASFAPPNAPPLNAAQLAAVERIAQASPGQALLLHGITGSGKTEVYLAAMAAIVAAGKQALLLVPEINLTPSLVAQVSRRFAGQPVAVMHSAMNESERLHAWMMAASGQAKLVVGTRLAMLCPLPQLGLIVVDEEHDPSFKQAEGMRYSARDVAVWRAHQRGVPVVLGSATPSLESWANARQGRYVLLPLKERAVAKARLPQVRTVDSHAFQTTEGIAEPIWSALRARAEAGEQALVFLNRRGYAPVLACAACGWVAGCPRCTAHLVWHRADARLRCHHCAYEEAVPRACPTCGNVDIKAFGRGTQRLETSLQSAFPGKTVLRIDRDSTRQKGSAERLLAQALAGPTGLKDKAGAGDHAGAQGAGADEREGADILVGTQMLAKGHDFKALTLVVVLNADAALFSADFRAAERLFAQLMQVAGRAGRDTKPGEVLVQTRHPNHPLYRALIAHDYDSFANALLEERATAGLPPTTYQALLRAEAKKLDSALHFLKAAKDAGEGMVAGHISEGASPENTHEKGVFKAYPSVTFYDPIPMTLTRMADRERAQLLLESASRSALQAILAQWEATLYALPQRGVRWWLEVDPQDI